MLLVIFGDTIKACVLEWLGLSVRESSLLKGQGLVMLMNYLSFTLKLHPTK